MPASSVPRTIHFDSDLLLVPTFEEAGIPRHLAELGTVRPEVGIGQWVDRGDVLLSATFPIYATDRKPRFFADRFSTTSVSLRSPVSGLVIDFRDESTSDPSSWGRTYYMMKQVLPVILVPRDEPPQDEWCIIYFKYVGRLLREHWRLLQFDHRDKGRVRLGELLPEMQDSGWPAALAAIERFEDPVLSEFEIRQMNAGDTRLVSKVQHLRAHDLVLRDKLVHLTRLDAPVAD